MLVEQAVFTSTNAGHLHGYQLVARSKGITDSVAAELCRWSPGHDAMQSESVDTISVNFYPIQDSRFVLSSSCYGGPEYSRRGCRQIVTHILVLTGEQFARYHFNSFAVADAATSSGALILKLRLEAPMPQLFLPDRPLGRMRSATSDPVFQRAIQLAGIKQPFAVIGAGSPENFAMTVLAGLEVEHRAEFSFSTCLKLTEQRPFQMQFFPAMEIRLENQLRKMGIRTLNANGLVHSAAPIRTVV
ncbi:MAG: hypothetical protein AAF456_15230 [Planctomycetota bacterium]